MAKIWGDAGSAMTPMSFGKSFDRMNGQPLDRSAVITDTTFDAAYSKAATFAASDNAYVGMILSVSDGTITKFYGVVNEVGDLQEVGSGAAIELDTTLAVAGKAADAKSVGDEVNRLSYSIAAHQMETNKNVTTIHLYDDSRLSLEFDELLSIGQNQTKSLVLVDNSTDDPIFYNLTSCSEATETNVNLIFATVANNVSYPKILCIKLYVSSEDGHTTSNVSVTRAEIDLSGNSSSDTSVVAVDPNNDGNIEFIPFNLVPAAEDISV